MALPATVQRIVDWLRAGYPDGVPEHDYLPLFALLTSQYAEDDVRQGLQAVPDLSHGQKLAEILSEHRTTPPTTDDIDRVRGHLMAAGWDFKSAVAATTPPETTNGHNSEPT